MIPVVIGLGTGRCGTQSLSKLLGNCDFRHCTHERAPQLPWEFVWDSYRDRLQELQNQRHHHDVALHYLPYIEQFIRDESHIKVIGLWREKNEVVESFIKKTLGQDDWRENFFKIWVQFYEGKVPDHITQREALQAYWNHYNETLERLLERYPDVVKIFHMNDLNTKQDEIFDWAEIPAQDRQYMENPRYNTIQDHFDYVEQHGTIRERDSIRRFR